VVAVVVVVAVGVAVVVAVVVAVAVGVVVAVVVVVAVGVVVTIVLITILAALLLVAGCTPSLLVIRPVTDLRIARREILVVPADTLRLAWTSPVCNATGICDSLHPAECVEVAVIRVPRKVGLRWWEQPTVYDTLARFPAVDGQRFDVRFPGAVTGAAFVVSRDSARNWSPWSNLVSSRLTEAQ
jgi:hypothetical protein